jgi:outer membrane receptor protein involved in Fe transport
VRGDNDIGQLAAPIMFFRDTETGHSVQQEVRLGSAEDAEVTWLAGIFYFRHEYERGRDGEPMFGPNGDAAFHPIWSTLLRGIPLALPGQSGVHQSRLDTRYSSIFANATWQIIDRLSLTTSLRWQREEKRAEISNSVTAPGASLISMTLTPALTPTGEPVNGAIARESDNVTWSITPHFRITNSLMAYLEIARGAKSGGFNTGFGNASLAAREFGDEDIRHLELGTRAALAGGRARLSAAAFYTEYRDYQDAAFVSAQFSVGNADRVVLRGAELEGVVQVSGGLVADISISLADLTYATNTTGACYPGRTPDGTALRSCNLAGEHPINAPVWSTHLGMQQQYNLQWGKLYARIDWSWTDEYNTSFSADPRLVQDDSSDVALRVGAVVASRYELVLWADNMLGEDVTSIDAVLNLFNDASYQSFMTGPRSYGASVRVKF